MLASTQIAHVVMLYTNTSGKYVAHRQQYRSTLRAHRRGGILVGDRGAGDASVAITDHL